MGKVKMLLVGQDKNIDVMRVETKENAAIVNKNYQPLFDPECIFNLKEKSSIPLLGRFITKRRKREPTLIQILGKMKAEKLKAAKDLLDPLTNEESRKIVERNMALGLSEFKPISTIMFIILVLLIVFNLVIGFVLMGRMGVF